MKFTAVALLAAAGLASAQLPPACAITCAQDLASKTGCTNVADIACQCKPENQAAIAPCIQQKCSPADATAAIQAGMNLCKGQAGSSSSSVASGSVTGTSSGAASHSTSAGSASASHSGTAASSGASSSHASHASTTAAPASSSAAPTSSGAAGSNSTSGANASASGAKGSSSSSAAGSLPTIGVMAAAAVAALAL